MSENLHRNNAAEWVMVVLIAPIVWSLKAWKWCRKVLANKRLRLTKEASELSS